MTRNILTLLVFFISTISGAQTLEIQDSIPWNKTSVVIENVSPGEKFYIFNFPGAIHENNFLPYWSKTIALEKNYDIESVELVALEESNLNTSVLVAGKNQLKESYIYSVRTYKAAHKPYLTIKLMPIKKNFQTTIKLEKFKFKIKLKPAVETQTKKIKANSVLSEGHWVKIAIPQAGVYKLSYDTLKYLGFDDPEKVRVFGNDAGQLPFMNFEPRPQDLTENKVLYKDNNIYFYAKGSKIWYYDTTLTVFRRKPHYYSDTAYYFLSDLNTGYNNRIEAYIQPLTAPVKIYEDYTWYDIYETEINNVLLSGRRWYGGGFNPSMTKSYDFEADNLITGKSAKAYVELMGRSFYTSYFDVKAGAYKTQISFPPVTTTTGSAWGYDNRKLITFMPENPEKIAIELTYQAINPGSLGYIRAITVNAYRKLQYDEQTSFRFTDNTGQDEVCEARISSNTYNVMIWDVTNSTKPLSINWIKNSSGQITYRFVSDTLREFVIFSPEDAYVPVLEAPHCGETGPQNLHATQAGTEMLIISPPQFLSQAKSLANLHRKHDNMEVKTVSTEKIYNEFSSGIPDAVAIRDYIRFVYKLPGSKLKYVILFGDGAYINKPFLDWTDIPNFIPTYQTENSLNENGYLSITSDDFFGLLDDNEGETEGLLDVNIGRLPVASTKQAQAVVDKINHYLTGQSRSPWINNMLLLADNGNENLFVTDAENISDYMDTWVKPVISEKIYLPAYPSEGTFGGTEFPLAVKAVFNAIESGSSIFTFLGHGNYQVMTAERVVTMSDMAEWKNYDKLFLLQSGTCNFGRFDIYSHGKNLVSGGEFAIINPRGGAIDAVVTTRYSYTSINYLITSTVSEYVYKYKSDGTRYTIGEALTIAKNTNPGYYNRIYTLLGDPAIVLNPTEYKVKINTVSPDTVRALSKVTISGVITDLDGNELEDFNGEVVISVLDKKKYRMTLDASPVEFWTQNDLLFKGKASAINGKFEVNFIVPKDMESYKYGESKISAYTYSYPDNGQGTGWYSFIVGGLNDTVINDNQGPEIELYFNDTTFIDGGLTDANPKLIVKLHDESGINTTNTDLGHVLKATLDGKEEFLLNKYYVADKDSYKKGSVEFNLYKIAPGKHTITVEAYDVLNNRSVKSIDFIVAQRENLTIDRLFNYPNPFTTHTDFYFGHNRAGEQLDVMIQIFSMSGRLVRTIRQTVESNSFIVGPISWDGTDDYGHRIGKGVYLYRVVILAPDGQKAEKFEKLLILR